MAATTTATTNKEKALWLMEELVPGAGINNLGFALHVAGRLRPDALREALAVVVARTEALRTVFRAGGADLVKEILPADSAEVSEVTVEPLELSGAELEKDLTAFVDRPFPLEGDLLIRAGHARGPDGDLFCLGVHHLAFDMTSAALFLQEFLPVYEAIVAGRPVPPAPARPSAGVESRPRPADLEYWRENLSGFTPGTLDLWCGRPRVHRPMMRGDYARHPLSGEALAAIGQLQRKLRAPVAAVLLAAYSALLVAHGAGADLVVGTPVDVRGENSGAIGYHVNVVPIRMQVDLAAGFGPLVRHARDAFLGAMAHAHTSVEELTGELPGIGSTWQTALYRHLFNFVPDSPVTELAVAGHSARLLRVDNPYSKFDLELVASQTTPEIQFRYSTENLDRADVVALLRRLDALLVAAARSPDRPLAETAGWSDTDRETVERAHRAPIAVTVPAATPARAAAALEERLSLTPGERALSGGRVSIVAPDGRELPVGVRGELCLDTGDGPARTGELARWSPDGAIEWLGQLGRRFDTAHGPVNLGDLEAALLDEPGVSAAAAVAVPADDGEHTVVVFAVAAKPLAAKEVPWPVVSLEALPETADGSVDTEALRLLAEREARPETGDRDHEDAVVEDLVRIWAKLLGGEATARTHFFEAGGHSLLGAVLAQQAEELTGTPLGLTEVFEHPTPAALAAWVRASQARQESAHETAGKNV